MSTTVARGVRGEGDRLVELVDEDGSAGVFLAVRGWEMWCKCAM